MFPLDCHPAFPSRIAGARHCFIVCSCWSGISVDFYWYEIVFISTRSSLLVQNHVYWCVIVFVINHCIVRGHFVLYLSRLVVCRSERKSYRKFGGHYFLVRLADRQYIACFVLYSVANVRDANGSTDVWNFTRTSWTSGSLRAYCSCNIFEVVSNCFFL